MHRDVTEPEKNPPDADFMCKSHRTRLHRSMSKAIAHKCVLVSNQHLRSARCHRCQFCEFAVAPLGPVYFLLLDQQSGIHCLNIRRSSCWLRTI